MTNANESIAPTMQAVYNNQSKGVDYSWNNFGLTKREYFASVALQGILANTTRTESYEDAAIFSIGYADALINELNKQ
jgi:hypothetical protein